MSARPPEPPVPLGWSFNPSERAHRARLLPFAVAGFLIASYLAACQAGHFRPWDPLFGDGSRRVLERGRAGMDAAVGAAAYLAEIALLAAGGSDRWLRRPWLAFLCGLTALGIGLASACLVFLQPVAAHAWCLLCLAALPLALLLLEREIPELLACAQTLTLLALRRGGWGWLLRGMPREEAARLGLVEESQRPGDRETARFLWTRGTRCAWTLAASALLGAAALVLAALFRLEGVARVTLNLAGALAVLTSFVAMCEPLRPLRWANGLSGSLLFFWFLGEPHGIARWLAAAIGAALLGLCIHRGGISGRYGIFTPRLSGMDPVSPLSLRRNPSA